MADFYKPKDVRVLVKLRKILFMGDSNVRPLYKDLLSAINKKPLTTIDILKSPDVDSYFGDIAIQQCGRKNTWSFWENRIYEDRGCRIEMFCTAQIVMDVIRGFLKKLVDVPSSLPDIVYLSYGPSHWKNRFHLLLDILKELKASFPCTTSFTVGSGFPTNTDSFGDPMFDEIPYFIKCNMVNDDENNIAIVGATSSLGFNYLNLAHYLRKRVFRGVASQPGWESVVVRYTTFLLLTNIAQNTETRLPGRVDQEVLMKAIGSSAQALDEYRMMLLRLTQNWNDLKSKVQVDEQTDPAAKNAREVLEKLWKDYRRSKERYKSSLDSECQVVKSNKRHKEVTDRRLLTIDSSSSISNCTTIDITSNKRRGTVVKDLQTDLMLPEKKEEVTTKIEVKDSPSAGNDWEQGECDTDSLEEGEIREPPCILLSDISSSEDNIIDVDENSLQGASQTRGTQRNSCSLQPVSIPSTSRNPPQPFTIELSDEEVDGEGSVLTYTSNQDAIINLDSGESDVEVGRRSITTTVINNAPYMAPRTLGHSFPKSSSKRLNKSILEPDCKISDLHLKDKNGVSVPWPTNRSILKGDALWKWWRSYIQEQNDSSLIMCPKDWPEVRCRIPVLFNEKGNIALPKVIDDLKQLFLSLKNIKFREDYLEDYSVFNIEEGSADKSNMLEARPPPMVEELSRDSDNRVQFQIPPKGTLKTPLLKANVSVCSFAAYRNFTARHSTATSAVEANTNGEHKTSKASSSEPPSRPSKSSSYDDEVYPQLNWTPCSSWVSTSSKTTRHSPERSDSKTDASRDRRKHSKPSADVRKRKRSRSRSPKSRSSSPRSCSHRRARSRSPSPYSKRRNTRRP